MFVFMYISILYSSVSFADKSLTFLFFNKFFRYSSIFLSIALYLSSFSFAVNFSSFFFTFAKALSILAFILESRFILLASHSHL